MGLVMIFRGRATAAEGRDTQSRDTRSRDTRSRECAWSPLPAATARR